MSQATLREWLTEAGFDWENGRIVYQEDEALPGIHIDNYHPILDRKFGDDGYGLPQCPRIVAKDSESIYFPVKYDGASWLDSVRLDLDYYTTEGVYTPYPGGG